MVGKERSLYMDAGSIEGEKAKFAKREPTAGVAKVGILRIAKKR